MASRWKDFRYAGSLQSASRAFECRAQSSAACTDNNHVKRVINDCICRHLEWSSDAKECKNSSCADGNGEAAHKKHEKQLPPVTVYIVVDDNLQAECHVEQQDDDERGHQYCVQRLGQECERRRLMCADQAERRYCEPDCQRNERDSGNALPPKVSDARMRGAHTAYFVKGCFEAHW